MRVRLAFLHLRPGGTPDEKTETQAAVRGPGLLRARSPRAQQQVSVGSKRNIKRKSEAGKGRGPAGLRGCGRGAAGRPRHPARVRPSVCRFPSCPCPLCLLVSLSLPEKEKGGKSFRFQRHFLADDKPHFQWVSYIFPFLEQPIQFCIFIFFFVRGRAHKYFETNKYLRKRQPPRGALGDSTAEKVS